MEIAVRAGMPFPQLIYAWAAGEALPPVGAYEVGLRMRWLGGDVEWLAQALVDRGHPDGLPPGRAIGQFVRETLRPQAYDYLDARDLRRRPRRCGRPPAAPYRLRHARRRLRARRAHATAPSGDASR